MKKGRHYSKEEIAVISQSAIGKSFREIRDVELITVEDEKVQKGSMGGIIEEVADYRNHDNSIGFSFRYY